MTTKFNVTNQNDIINGTALADHISSLGGDDTVKGAAGDDRIYGDNGNDTVRGEAGDDRLFGGNGDDTLYGDADNDRLYGGNGSDLLGGGTGNDTVNGDAGDDRIYGDNGNDIINGGTGNDRLFGGNGDDTIQGGSGDDHLYGGNGNDNIDGGSGNDTVYGGSGNDTINSSTGNDIMHGGEGNDTVIDDSNGYNEQTSYYYYSVFGYGTINHDPDQLFGNGGNDTLISGLGNDILHGGDGDDILSDSENDLYDVVDYGHMDGSERTVGNDIMYGGEGNDTLSGKYGANTLNGGGGDDLIIMDSLGGYAFTWDQTNNDETNFYAAFDNYNTVTGSGGADRFRFEAIFGDGGRDIITDFEESWDKIQLDAKEYAALGSSVEAGEFVNSATATTADQHLLYDKNNGALYYDADGSGSGEARHLGTVLTLTSTPAALDHTSFEIV